jgi:mannose/fructose/N-acetylgalactosamine-specific phosphotransferase system component IIC
MVADEFIRRRNSLLADDAFAAEGENAECKLSRAHLSGLIAFFLKSFVLYLFFIPAGLAAVELYNHLPDKVHDAMALFVKLLPLLGAALVLNKLSIAAFDRFFIAGFAAAAVLTTMLFDRPLVVCLLIIGAGFFGGWYRERRS